MADSSLADLGAKKLSDGEVLLFAKVIDLAVEINEEEDITEQFLEIINNIIYNATKIKEALEK